jgi:hypothetical protein
MVDIDALATRSVVPAARIPRVDRPLRRVWSRLTAVQLDARLATGQGPRASAAFACRAKQLVSGRSRRQLAAAVERVCLRRHERAVFSAAIPTDGQAIEIARPALEQLARALRCSESVQPGGVALTRVLLTDGTSPLYRPAYPEELYDVVRRSLRLLGPAGRTTTQVEGRDPNLAMEDQLAPR